MFRRVRLYFSVLILLFVFTCVTGYTGFIQDPNKVDCGGQQMEAGDVCEHTRNGKTTASNDYETEKQNQENAKLWSTIGFFPLLLGTIGWVGFGIYMLAKPKRASGVSARSNAYANNYPQQPGNYPQGGGYPPANQYPPQGYYPPPNNQR